ncbi:DUF2235 domain-containing protein [Flavobacterium sp. ANB]|uniref:phospholipase effector Tle1 domain-containing protein n=1 Tax=unclassified Flavobacterium TaxID=196869 RepID=UPI0012B82356|nr:MULTISPECIES: DUF2235 domain-containing protein [unclassified Flavobacterium]MBF4515640.1 DUF2235 domain-containing protein [Flavobacterium sp. ANB]MTD68643.1 hypothetical protein [Flavobacterium sp. LC2016-13]
MSITRIIGGSFTKTATGNIELHATNGNINLHAATQNNWDGGENGIFHHDYEPSHPEDLMSNRLDLTLNLFFDGTGNNRENTSAREYRTSDYEKESNKKDDSYENDYTNIARAYDVISTKKPIKINASKPLKVYVEGVGTRDLKSDDMLPMGIAQNAGFWNTGIKDKVKVACEKGALEIKDASDGKPIDLLTINVYGFSRGAATARHFLDITNVAYTVKVSKEGYFTFPGDLLPKRYPKNQDKSKPDYPESFDIKLGYFGRCLVNNGVFEIKNVSFNFVGLYDTVSSHGFNHNNDVKDLGLDAIKKAKMVFQLSAADEYRENFDLTNIDSAGLKGLELTLPGVHSDIGGSYIACDIERSVILKEKYFTGTRDAHFKFRPTTKKADAFKELLVNEGWYKDHQLILEYNEDAGIAYLVGRRELENAYDKIALNKMIMVSNQFGVEYDENKKKKKTNLSDPFLASIFDQLTKYSQAVMMHRNQFIREKKPVHQYWAESKQISYLDYLSPTDLKELRNRYLHWSVKADHFGLGPRFNEVLPVEKRKREIHNG